MPFDWYHSKIPDWYGETFDDKRVAMYIEDMKTKATLLRNLGHTKEYARLRLRGNIRWAYENLKTPAYIDKVDEVVDSVFSE